MKALLIPVLLLVAVLVQESSSQLPRLTSAPAAVVQPQVQVSDSFRANLIKAIQTQRQAGKITPREAMRLRIACFSPAFLERAQELAVIQIACSGEQSPAVPTNADGMIEVASIDWNQLLAFLEKLLPLILQLIAAFGA
jgi:hypothetical protein